MSVNIELTSAEIWQAMEDLDANKYTQDVFTTRENGITYDYLSPKGNVYGPKRIAECALLNRGEVYNYNEFTSNPKLRRQIEAAGCPRYLGENL